jgi:hypothetical protein
MPLGKGYFLGPDGEVIRVFKHLDTVEANPARFGLRPEDVVHREGENRIKGARRRRVLTLALRNGFCRVRFHRDRNVVEFYAGSPEEEARRLTTIAEFLKRQGVKVCAVRNIARASS